MANFTTIRPVLMRAFLDRIINSWSVVPDAVLVGEGTLRLVTAGPSPITPLAALADFTVADFGGYANLPYEPTTVKINLPSGQGRGWSGNGLFVCNGEPGNNVVGYLVVDGLGALVMAEYFPSPMPVNNNGDFVDVTAILALEFEPQVS